MAITTETGNCASYDITLPADNSTVTQAHDFGSAADRLAAVRVSFRSNNIHEIATVTIGGVAMTMQGGTHVTENQMRTYLFTLKAPASGSVNIVVDPINGVGASGATLDVMVWSGVDQTTPIDGYTSATGTDSTAELSITSAVGDVAAFFASLFGSDVTSAAATGYTERLDNAEATFGASTAGDTAGAATVSCTATFTTSGAIAWTAQGFNINNAAGGGGRIHRASPLDGLGGVGQKRFNPSLSYHRSPISLQAYRRERAREMRAFMEKVRRAA